MTALIIILFVYLISIKISQPLYKRYYDESDKMHIIHKSIRYIPFLNTIFIVSYLLTEMVDYLASFFKKH